MSRTLIIAEPSEIIRKGLVHIIDSLDLFDRIHEVNAGTVLESAVSRLDPDVLIINPSFFQPAFQERLDGLKNEKIKIAGIVCELQDEEYSEFFDVVIKTADTRLKIKNKLGKLISSSPSRNLQINDNSLSAREKDVVRLLARGLTNKEIADKLFISPHTTMTHRKNITRKLNIKSVAGLLVYAIINEIVTVDEMQQE